MDEKLLNKQSLIEYFRIIAKNIPFPLYLVDKKGVIVAINPAAYENSNLGPDSIIGLNLNVLIELKDKDISFSSLLNGTKSGYKTDVMLDKGTEHCESELIINTVSIDKFSTFHIISIKYKDNSSIPKTIETSMIFDSNPMEGRQIFNYLDQIITILDGERTIIDANKAAIEFFKTPLVDLVGKKCWEMYRGRDRNDPCPDCPLSSESKTSTSSFTINNHQFPDKRYKVKLNFVFDDDGLISKIIHSSEDVTEQKKLELQVFQTHKMEAVGTLAGGIAHDFNNLLTIISGYAELAMKQLDQKSSSESEIEEILIASQRAKEIINRILLFSRKSELKRERVNTEKIIRETVNLFKVSLPSSVKLIENYRTDIPKIRVVPAQLSQIVLNLCTNALSAIENEKGDIEINLDSVNFEQEDFLDSNLSSGKYILLSVRDTGSGIDKSILNKIFEPYFTTKKKGRGTGMGLAVVHGIVTDHKGFIRVNSTPGEGTEIKVYLPVSRRKSGELTMKKSTQSKKIESSEKIRILLVDDETKITKVMKLLLEHENFDVTAMNNSTKALEIFKNESEKFDLIISDQTMPNLTGEDLSREILKISPQMPIIILSGFSETFDEAKAEALGIRKFLLKPVKIDELKAAIHEVLNTQDN